MVEDIVARLREFIESEVRSGSMDYGCITPLYVYRMWGGAIPMVDGAKGTRIYGWIKRLLKGYGRFAYTLLCLN